MTLPSDIWHSENGNLPSDNVLWSWLKAGGLVGDAENNLKIFAGVIRISDTGVPSLLDDANHKPFNLTDVNVITDPLDSTKKVLQLDHGFTGAKVVSMDLSIDDSLAKMGILAGASIGTSLTYINFSMPFNVMCTLSSTSPSLFGNEAITDLATVSITDNVTTIEHPTLSMINDVPNISGMNLSVDKNPNHFKASFDDSSVSIRPLTHANAYISYSGATWNSSNHMYNDDTLTWNTDKLEVRHNGIVSGSDAGDLPQLTGVGGIYIPQIMSYTKSGFDVAFFDYTGTKITTPDTNMKFSYDRSTLVESSIQEGKVSIRRGQVHIDPDNIKIAGTNVQVYGLMRV